MAAANLPCKTHNHYIGILYNFSSYVTAVFSQKAIIGKSTFLIKTVHISPKGRAYLKCKLCSVILFCHL